jgi:CRISPR-associated protein Csb2
MPLTLSLRFPTGRYAAAAWDDKERAEWPPHPARLALAFIDVLHKAGNPATLRDALVWLCQQGAPSIIVPTPAHVDIQQMDGFYVPQNPSEAGGPKHPRKPRSFPTVFLDPEQDTVFFHWPDSNPEAPQITALEDLTTRLPRYGHSSSLVIATATTMTPPSGDAWRLLEPVTEATFHADHRLRIPYANLLESAEAAYAADSRAKEMADLINKAAKSANPEKKTLKPSASPRGRHDPRHLWQGYVEALPPSLPATPWDHRVLLLARIEGPRPGLVSTWQLLETFHKTLLDRWSREPSRGPVPPWISGHQPGSGSTAPALENHLAFFPIADVNHKHAQGRLMGIGLAFPRPETAGIDAVTMRLDWQNAMTALFPQGAPLELVSPASDTKLILTPADTTEGRAAFQRTRWLGPSTQWASVTPIVLDRHPKPHFSKNPIAWQQSACQIVHEACQRIGLPAPTDIEVSSYSPLQGVPPSSAFAPPPARAGRPARVHFHVTLTFDQKIAGPVLLGAGRFRGYGLLAPI